MGWETYEPPTPEATPNKGVKLGFLLMLVVFVNILFIELSLM